MLDAIIDVSHHNGPNLNFGAAKTAGILGVIQKPRKVSRESIPGSKATGRASAMRT